jgi:hypothetical protein
MLWGGMQKKETEAIKKPIPRISKKRQKEIREYSKERKKFLTEGDKCEAGLPGCTITATDVHHMRGRAGGNFLNRETWLKVCRSCHTRIEQSPLMAKKLGLSESRLKS